MAHKFGDCSCKSDNRIPPDPSVTSKYKSIINDLPINFASDKPFGLSDTSQRGLDGYTTVGSERHQTSSVILTIQRNSFRALIPNKLKKDGSCTSTILCYANRQGYGTSIGNRLREVCMVRGRVLVRMKRTATLVFSVPKAVWRNHRVKAC
jgi:hypothetical protein